jgi:hypothetical protein
MKFRRVLPILIFFLGISDALPAQQSGSWSDLNRLKSGQSIQVVETNMKRHDGNFVAATDELLSLTEEGANVSMKRSDVARVSISSGAKRGKHAVIGLLIGGGAGAGIGALSGSSHGFLGGSSRGLTALAGVIIGAPSGAIVGAVLPAHTTVYRAEQPRQAPQP